MNKLVLAGLVVSGACGSSADPPVLPEVSAATFVANIDNPYFPLPPGARWAYEITTDAGLERADVLVTQDTRVIQGVTARVVRDTVRVNGVVREDTYDWFAQDTDGNVWYLGEETCVYENGQCVDTEGSWEWGQDGALPGYAMPANPTITGEIYRQEYYRGAAEDTGEVITVAVSATTPVGSYTNCITTHDASTLDLNLDEEKTYCPGVGLVHTDENGGREELVEAEGL